MSLPSNLLMLMALATPICAAESPSEFWREVSVGLFKDANRYFGNLSGPEAELGQALTLLVLQPKTTSNLDRAETLLAHLATRPASEEIGQAARYYLARLQHVHRQNVDLLAAKAIYEALIQDAPRSFYAYQAQVKLAIIELYDVAASPPELRTRFDKFVRLAAEITDKSARRDLSFLLADVAQQFNYEKTIALDLLLQADKAGITRSAEQATTWVRIGELARLTGRDDVARQHYQSFLANYPRDRRRLSIQERLATLSSAP
jgi:tetratricopeptide (TPR) repeat protein